MEIRYLRHFLAVAEELHFSRAARRLNMEQAPLSQSIRRLEDHLGTRLFDRSARGGTRLTEAGRRLRVEAERAVIHFEAAMQSARHPESAGPVIVNAGFVTLGLLGPLPRAIRAMATIRPEVSVRLQEGATASLLERVSDGRLDLALVHPVDRAPRGLELVQVRRDRIVAALPAEHPLANRNRITLHDLAAEPLIFFPPAASPDLHYRLQTAFADLGIVPRIEQEARSTPTMLLLVAAGLGYALVAESARYLPFSNVSFLPVTDLPDGLDWSLALASNPQQTSEAGLELAELIRRQA